MHVFIASIPHSCVDACACIDCESVIVCWPVEKTLEDIFENSNLERAHKILYSITLTS